MTRLVAGVDFETGGIESRPDYPPVPVGVAIGGRLAFGKTVYLAWGHPTENNISKTDAVRILSKLWRDPKVEIVFHNGKFDEDVAETHLGLPLLPWQRMHDTMFLAFLSDPHSTQLGLKPTADRVLGIPPDERDELRRWIIDNVPEAKAKKSEWGRYICRAPGKLVGKYAIGDVDRTLKLFHHFEPQIRARNMMTAYERERKLLPYLLESERRGVPVDLPALERDVPKFRKNLDHVDGLIRKILRAKDLDLDKKDDLADALEKANVMKSWKLTKKGKRSTAKGALLEGLGDTPLAGLLTYRGAFATITRTFLEKWLAVGARNKGRAHVSWNQVRQSHGDGGDSNAGARTGRLSSNPNLMNVPTEKSPNYENIVKAYEKHKLDRLGVEPFPLCRGYIAAPRGKVLIDRDYSQQELRALGHYEGGVLLKAYLDDPWLDVHDLAQKLINGMLGTNFTRRPIKDTGFGLIYGMGIALLAKKTGADTETAKTLKKAYLEIFPGLKNLQNELTHRGRSKQPIRTWGGREYYVEPPRVVEGRIRTFEYKLLNVLIQGSSADCTKQAIINLHEHPKWEAGFILTVHDEILGEADRRNAKQQMIVMREAMESVEFDLPMLSEGEWGRAWASLDSFDKKGKGR